MFELVVIRHGESTWNKENRFTGWQDVDLSETGEKEAKKAGAHLRDSGLKFDVAYTSRLKRAIKTLNHVLDQMNLDWIPVHKDWRLNERHYGALQGLNKAEMAEKHGEAQVQIWRRSYDVRPPLMDLNDERHPSRDPRYKDVSAAVIPSGESLKDTVARFIPLWNEQIAPSIKAGKKALIAAHGNSLRALIQHLENLSQEQIMAVNMPTGIPMKYTLSADLKVLDKTFLGDEEDVKKAIEAVINQGKK